MSKKLHQSMNNDKWSRIAGYMEVNERTGEVRKMKLVSGYPIVYTGDEAYTLDKKLRRFIRNPRYDR